MIQSQNKPKGKQLVLANPRGFCAGVDRAIEIVELALKLHGAPVYVRKEIVHNPHVVEALREKGAIFVESEGEIPPKSVVIFSAHGVAPDVVKNAESRDLSIIDATCPLVTKVHLEAKKYVANGFTVVLIGHAGHDEIIGTMGEAPQQIKLVQTVEDALEIQFVKTDKLVCLTQTTLSVDDTREIVEILTDRFPSILVRNDICYATQNRQTAIKALADRVDLILVVGAANSSNSVRLMEVARAQGVNAHRISDVSEIDQSWLIGVTAIGLTSGASTPEIKVSEVLNYLQANSNISVSELNVIEENVTFQLPKELRNS